MLSPSIFVSCCFSSKYDGRVNTIAIDGLNEIRQTVSLCRELTETVAFQKYNDCYAGSYGNKSDYVGNVIGYDELICLKEENISYKLEIFTIGKSISNISIPFERVT